MLFKLSSYLQNLKPKSIHTRPISSLRVEWRKDPKLDQAILNDKSYKLCARVVNEVLNEPGHVIPIRYLENRRERLRLHVRATTFLNQNPGLFETYRDQIKPKTDLVPFIRPSDRLNRFLEEEKRIFEENQPLLVARLCKLLMMAKNRVLSGDKLLDVKREFGLPNDVMTNLVPKYPQYFKLIGSSGDGKRNSFLELVDWNPNFAKSVVELRADEEERLTGIRARPNINVKLPKGFCLKKEMREWTRDWIELDYISPYTDVSHLEPSSREMEKRRVGVFHELLSLSLHKRMPVPLMGKFKEEFQFSNDFSTAFTRHPGIFYLSRKGLIKTAMLREAYKGDELVDRDPLLEIKDRFVAMLEEGWRVRAEELRLRKEKIEKEREIIALKNKESEIEIET